MLPAFPQFKPIELSDKEAVESITHKYPPYSDFNFVSMWSWDIKGEMRISELNGNLVVRFTDYLTGEPFYSFLGDNQVNDTVEKLLELSKQEGLKLQLQLVPEDSIKNLDSKFKIEEDRDHFDYILNTETMCEHTTKKLRYHFNLTKRLAEESKEKLTVKILDLNIPEQRNEVLALTNTWLQNKLSNTKNDVSTIELDAINRFFLMREDRDLSLGILYNDKLIGCSINHSLNNEFSLCHFMKADSVFKGIYSCLFIETAKIMLKSGKKYLNIEQDLGLLNLRQSKQSFEPEYYLKKYKISIV